MNEVQKYKRVWNKSSLLNDLSGDSRIKNYVLSLFSSILIKQIRSSSTVKNFDISILN
jgi:hypothetical protein